MKPQEDMKPDDGEQGIQVVVGMFDSHEDASRVAASLRRPDIKVQKISRADPATPDEMPSIVYDDIEEVTAENISSGAIVGGAIGAGSGLLLLGIPILNIAAPIAGALAGAWIGAVAGIDEAHRGVQLPNQDEYQKMLAAGKSFVVIAGDEAVRTEVANEMKKLGAVETHQHPPIRHVVR